MKFSKYNIIHTTENQEHILFNSLWGSTFVISPSVKQAIESSNPTLLTEEENRLFIKQKTLLSLWDKVRIIFATRNTVRLK